MTSRSNRLLGPDTRPCVQKRVIVTPKESHSYSRHVVAFSNNQYFLYSMCSLVVSVLDSPAVDPRSNPGSGSALLMSEKSQAVYYISSCHMLIDKRSPVTSQTVTGSRLTGYIVNMMHSPVIEKLMVRGSQVELMCLAGAVANVTDSGPL